MKRYGDEEEIFLHDMLRLRCLDAKLMGIIRYTWSV